MQDCQLILSDALDALSVIKKLDELSEGQFVYVEDRQYVLIKAEVKLKPITQTVEPMYYLESRDHLYYIDEPDDDEDIPGIFVCLTFPKSDYVDAQSEVSCGETVNWNKEGF